MSAQHFTLSKPQLMILFNALDDLGLRAGLTVSLPLLQGLDICRFGLGPTGASVTNFIAKPRYLQSYRDICDTLKAATKKEIPCYEDIRDALCQAGIFKLEGISPLEQILSSIKTLRVTGGGDAYYIALDTNLLRNRFFSTYLQHLAPHPNIDYVLCETVRDELANRGPGKITQEQLKEIKTLPFQFLRQNFLNQICLEDRKRYIGLLEYNRMRSATACEEIDSQSFPSSTKNDRTIIDAYSSYVGIGQKIVFLSMDNEIIMQMRGEENVIPILLEQPFIDQTSFHAPWKSFFDFLYILGVLFGEIILSADGRAIASIWGVWRGKDAREWEQDQLKIQPSTHQNTGGRVQFREKIIQLLDSNLAALHTLDNRQ